ncbi:nuclear transport factor 2 family protein [Pseudoxanthomonas sp. 22568]|uniref:nuclear transport factor 2 family protein n=1 Tax=Pseudoxanthomonas sp. 22568 TaxID=3453945 RepID=UPI003F8386A8
MNDADKQALIQRYITAYNAFDIDGMVALLSDDVRFENHAGGALTTATDGSDAFRALAEQSRWLFSVREQRVTSWRFDPERTIVEIDYRGTLAQNIPDGPSAGTELALQGRSEFGFAGDRINHLADFS